ncbi:type I-C CRISPR-associated protein Cas8c/Csd1 [Fictibacillus macauensis]|uniref:type I-C CRISPR-associated protein Cas8c/Csd1 n=1 Tax=Fictibacillus macauensis TaxID=245160 RepID=UPI0005915ED9|nr:type I-C CRISPR-associated protein Cas8c/Csd1 [Fictibacillus macauensis]
MSWLLNLYETYQSNLDRVGEIQLKSNGQEYTLLPISHTTQNAHIEVSVTEEGEFHSATVIDKTEATTLIPCTEGSSSRAGAKVAPYPLHDKLPYVAGDFVAYGGTIKNENPYHAYIKQLQEWAESPHSVPKLKSIYRYVSKGELIKDLVAERVLFLDEHQQLFDAWDKKLEEHIDKKPELFSTSVTGQESAFVRFNVYSQEAILTDVWKDPDMHRSFQNFYNERLGGEDYCFVTGEEKPSTDKHANKIRNAADKAKLISANDKSGFTFRGRFHSSDEAASISYEVSQKAHNALKWLINKQGKIIDQRVFLIWANDTTEMLDPMEDTFSLMQLSAAPKVEIKSYTDEHFAQEFSKTVDGYRGNLDSCSNVSILVLDSATTGRLAVNYYRNLNKELYLDKLKKWHETCVWRHAYRKDAEHKWFYGAPATKDIAFAAYGSRANEKVVKGLMERMLPCIIDGRKIPVDIVRSAIQRASSPVGMETWEWEKTLSVTCALINSNEEGLGVALDTEIQDRSYLFGRLLAIADVLERRALNPGESRATNAIRYMNAFSRHPERTWSTIQAALQPYQAKLGAKAIYLNSLLDEVASSISIEEFNNKPLSGKYLLGFYSQRHALYQKKETTTEPEVTVAQ